MPKTLNMSFSQYLKDTQGELHHVAWPSRTQTVVYTIFVAVISIATALYLGLFDYLFTTALGRFVESRAIAAPSAQELPSTNETPIVSTSTSN